MTSAASLELEGILCPHDSGWTVKAIRRQSCSAATHCWTGASSWHQKTAAVGRLLDCSGHRHFLRHLSACRKACFCYAFLFCLCTFESWKFDSDFSRFPVRFAALFSLMIRPYQLFCWWRCPQLILACLVFQEVSFLCPPPPIPPPLVISDWNLSEPQQAGNLLLYKNILHCSLFLLF